MTTLDITTQITATDDPNAMRRLVLEALAARTEERHARLLALDLEAPARLAAVVAVITEASAYWALESARTTTTAEYREIAADMYQVIGDQIPGLIAAAMSPELRARVRAQVVADMRGPSDD